MIEQDLDADEFHFEPVFRSSISPRRYRHACAMIARQQAFKIAGASWQAYFEEHRGRLIEDAKELISCEQQHHRQ
jgi:hypothetical protein